MFKKTIIYVLICIPVVPSCTWPYVKQNMYIMTKWKTQNTTLSEKFKTQISKSKKEAKEAKSISLVNVYISRS